MYILCNYTQMERLHTLTQALEPGEERTGRLHVPYVLQIET